MSITDQNGVASTIPFQTSPTPLLTPTFNFNWVPSINDTGIYTIILELTDEGCPTARSTIATFTVQVNGLPFVQLGNSFDFNCSSNFVLEADSVFTNAGPLTFQWGTWVVPTMLIDTLSTDETFPVNLQGNYGLQITDINGCSAIDTIILRNDLVANFVWDTFCLGLPTRIRDVSNSGVDAIIRTDWSFTDVTPQMFTNDTVEFTFSSVGEFEVTLEVEDAQNCVEEVTRTITICAPPVAALDIIGNCSAEDGLGEGIQFIDLSDYDGASCGPASLPTLRLIDSTGTKTQPLFTLINQLPTGYNIAVSDSGDYTVEWVAISVSGCRDTVVESLRVDPRPLFTIETITPFSINCDQPDTILIALPDSSSAGTGPLLFNSAPYSRFDTLEVFANTVGTFPFVLEDSLGCMFTQQANIIFTVDARFAYDTVCNFGDTMFFFDQSTNSFPLVSWEWDFGDGIGTSMLQTPNYVYGSENDFSVSLRVTDSTGCTDSTSFVVFNTFPILDTFDVQPQGIPICVADNITGFTGFDNPITGSHIDRITWDYGDGVIENFTGPAIVNGSIVTHAYTAPIETSVNNTIIYNTNPFFPDRACSFFNETMTAIDINPELAGVINDNRTCLRDTALFVYERIVNPTIPVSSYQWTISEPITTNVLATASDSLAKVFMDDRFQSNISYPVQVIVEDTNGCRDTVVSLVDVNSIPPIQFSYTSACPDEEIQFDFLIDDITGVPLNVRYFFIDGRNGDTIATDLYRAPTSPSIPFATEFFTFNEEGTHQLFLNLVQRQSAEQECRSVNDTLIPLFPVPDINVSFNEACAQDEATVFTNASTIVSGTIESYLWDFGNGNTSTEVSPSFVYQEGGIQEVSLTAISDSNCSQTETFDSVYVRFKPTADFFIDSELIEAEIPLQFIDQSTLGTADQQIIAQGSWYNFQDGSDTLFNELDPIHTYDVVAIYFVEHAVTTTEGCTDTVAIRTDLNVYLDIPTAFTPNADGNNDVLRLISKSIRELQTYRIYNRWGQVIFDAEGDLQAGWDGTYRGGTQPAGVYVVHVQGVGAYGEQFNFKKNITLIR